VVRAPDADWLKAVYDGYDSPNYVGNQFIIAVRNLGVCGTVYGRYTTAKGCIQALRVVPCLRTALRYIGHIPHPLRPYCLSIKHNLDVGGWHSWVDLKHSKWLTGNPHMNGVCIDRNWLQFRLWPSSTRQHIPSSMIVAASSVTTGPAPWPVLALK
jgi:hypothetical protein